MDFDFTPEQEAFRKEVRLWLERNLPDDLRGRGFAASLVEQIILYQEMARAESPQLLNRGGLSMLGPTLMKYGTPAQQGRFLTRILTAEDIWCQGFSEPNAGSD